MGWPQITMIVLMAVSAVIHIEKHGQPRGTYNIFTDLIGTAIAVGLLYAGGFFHT